jgi:chloride channel 7
MSGEHRYPVTRYHHPPVVYIGCVNASLSPSILDAASSNLTLTDADTAIKQLFHFREGGAVDTSIFSSGALFLLFVPYIMMATVTYGIAVPSGLFVPSLLSGAAFGRLFGHLLHKLDHANGTFADSGTYALMGAAAVLGGMARMT